MSEIEDLGVRTYRIGPSGGGGRSPILVGAFVVVLVAVVGFAVLGEEDAVPSPSLGPGDAAVASGSPTPRPSSTRRATPSPTPGPVLPVFPNVDLPGSPLVAIGVRSGTDGTALEVQTWGAGDGAFGRAKLVPDVLVGPERNAYTNIDLAPRPAWQGDGVTGVAVRHVFSDRDAVPRGEARVFGPTGTLWQSGEGSFHQLSLWSPDGSTLAVGGAPVWSILRFEGDELVSVHSVRVAADPNPAPSPSGEFGHVEPPPMPYPFVYSADGRWVYGALWTESLPSVRAVFRIDLRAESPTAEPVERFLVGDGGLAFTGGYSEALDPGTGRMAELDYSQSEPDLLVVDPDGAAVRVLRGEGSTIGSYSWTGDGDLIATVMYPEERGDRFGPARAEVLDVDGDGSGTELLLGAERVDGAWVTGSRPGYVLIVFWAGDRMLLVLMRTADGATGAIEVPRPLRDEIHVLELIDR